MTRRSGRYRLGRDEPTLDWTETFVTGRSEAAARGIAWLGASDDRIVDYAFRPTSAGGIDEASVRAVVSVGVVAAITGAGAPPERIRVLLASLAGAADAGAHRAEALPRQRIDPPPLWQPGEMDDRALLLAVLVANRRKGRGGP
jgi:hypothetical protein